MNKDLLLQVNPCVTLENVHTKRARKKEKRKEREILINEESRIEEDREKDIKK